ncbi:MAG TPA: peptidoglycan DD-metalloendopeptidase family protein [Actinomycetota bacterium]|nr:peptidoglycan DD-metalloendopeptidase family protein [Actinomycetota bacterium]
MTMGTTRTRIATACASFLLLSIGLSAAPVGAQSTEERLEAAKDRLARIDREAEAATAEYEAARGRYIATKDRIDRIRGRMKRAERRIGRLQGKLSDRAREAYLLGTSSTLEILLEAEDFSEFSDRMVFLDTLAQQDADLVVQVEVLSEELRRTRSDLKTLSLRQQDTLKVLNQKKRQIFDKLAEAQAIREKLEDKLKAERAVLAVISGGSGSTAVIQGQALQACPAPGSSFVDSWGAPRSGGRSHQGVDMMAPSGTPVYAAQSGTVRHSSSSLGGISAQVVGKDTTYYMHLRGYSDVGSGQQVSAGTLIGYVGDTGNATGSPHLHFEYHPGGGGAVNPYPYVRAVC